MAVDSSDFLIYYQNTRGLRTKTIDFYQSVCAAFYDCISITESWLKSSVLSSELFPACYNVFRLDRDPLVSGKSDGGGVLLAVRDVFSAECVPKWCNTNSIIEDLWVSVALRGGKKLFICTVYIPPYATINNYLQFLSKLDDLITKNINNDFLLLGDFNLPNLNWQFNPNDNDLFSQNATDPCSQSFSDSFFLNGLKQYNNVLNERNRILDLVMSNSLKVNVTKCDSPFVSVDSHHMPLDISVNLTYSKNISSNSYNKLKFENADYITINNKIMSYDWKCLLGSSDIDTNVKLLYKILDDIVQAYVPTIVIRKSKYLLWFSRNTINLIKDKSKAHKKWKVFKGTADFANFSNLRKKVKKSIKTDYQTYTEQTEENLNRDTKYFWSFINNKKKHEKFAFKNEVSGYTCLV